ncbi:MAG: sugar-transfer associated ATP-grasp domain-containing protein [Oscillospiraceae bacterium]
MIVNYDKLGEVLLENGMHPTRAKEMVKQIRQDILDWPEMYEDWEKCKWMLERGFVPGRQRLFGEAFNENTYLNYYPDFDYFMAHPLNNHFAFWINDKLTLKYMLNTPELSKYMPEYYLYIENDGHYSYLMDAPSSIKKDSDFLYNLLIEKKHLALKPNHGSGGRGFFGLLYQNGQIYMNGKLISREEFEELKLTLNGYIVTEFIAQSKEMENVFEGTDCALRIVLYKKVQEQLEADSEYGCMIAYARFGSSRSDFASNLCHGGLAVQIDWDTGTYRGGFRGNSQFWGEEGAKGFSTHPDTNVRIDGMRVPHWNAVKAGLIDICCYLSSLDFFGMDVIITEDGFKLCEINSAPSTGLGQFHQGKCCLDNEDARKFAAQKKRKCEKSFIECFQSAVEEY